MSKTYDAIIGGGEHNGLTAAGYQPSGRILPPWPDKFAKNTIFAWSSFVPAAADELSVRHAVHYPGLRSENSVIPVLMPPDI
jgi:hypothetical protein